MKVHIIFDVEDYESFVEVNLSPILEIVREVDWPFTFDSISVEPEHDSSTSN